MAKNIRNFSYAGPPTTKKPGQQSLNYEDAYFTRYIAPWSRPSSLTSDVWRSWVLNEPVAGICRETLISYLLSLDWKITSRDSNMRDELTPTIKYYTKLFDKGGYTGLDYAGWLEWAGQDLLDLPFGTMTEIGRKNDSPDGRVRWFKPVDGGTCYPTLNEDYPVTQIYSSYDPVVFPAHAVARTYISPRPELIREGWGMAPPEKVYMALVMLLNGDKYYASLLSEVPTAGILDLGDMEKDSALEWVAAFRNYMMGGVEAFKIPVLYEHTQKTEFISFGKVPNDIMFDRITMKYAAIVCASYGVSLSDIGLQTASSSGETLAGSIRQERRTQRIGMARLKKKFKGLAEQILPDTLQFDFIDLDSENILALGRARLANATAWNTYAQMQAFSPKEARLQTVQDGLITISIPEEPPMDEMLADPASTNAEPELVKDPKSPSSGGMGDVKLSLAKDYQHGVRQIVGDVVEMAYPVMVGVLSDLNEDTLPVMSDAIDKALFSNNLSAIGFEMNLKSRNIVTKIPQRKLSVALGDVDKENITKWSELMKQRFTDFVGRSSLYLLKDMLFQEDVFDDVGSLSYDSIVNSIIGQVTEMLPDLADTFLQSEINKIRLGV